jgi:mono/diheme cytochrome c family protein
VASARGHDRTVLRWVIRIVIAGVVIFALIQAIPYGRNHTNPPVQAEPKWDSPHTRQLAKQACFDCHSNETTWKWYTNVAPFSWLAYNDVTGGRSTLNFSEWNRPQDSGASDVIDAVRSGSMPPWFYTPLHPKSSLSATEKAQLEAGFAKTFKASPPIGGGGGG